MTIKMVQIKYSKLLQREGSLWKIRNKENLRKILKSG